MAVKSQVFWIVLLAAGCAAVLSWGCASDGDTEAKAHHKQGVAHAKKGEWDEAIESFTKAIELGPRKPLTYIYRGDAYLGRHEYAAAVRDYTKAIELEPRGAEAYVKRGLAYSKVFRGQDTIFSSSVGGRGRRGGGDGRDGVPVGR